MPNDQFRPIGGVRTRSGERLYDGYIPAINDRYRVAMSESALWYASEVLPTLVNEGHITLEEAVLWETSFLFVTSWIWAEGDSPYGDEEDDEDWIDDDEGDIF